MSKWYQFWKQDVIIQKLERPKEDKTSESLNEKIDKEPLARVRESLKEWGEVVEAAENPFMPIGIKQMGLLNLYRNIAIDEHLFALTETIYNRVRETPFKIFTNNVFNEEKTNLFKKSWFSKFIKLALEAEYWRFSLIQFLGIEDGTFSGIDNIDRFYVRPERKGVAKTMWQDEIKFSYDKKPYSDWCLFIESQTHLGRYNIVAKRFILKREVIQFWAVFNELYTTPYLTVKTQFNNANHRNDLITSLQNRKHSGFQVIDLEDDIQAVPLGGGAGHTSYKEFEDSSNKGMSKAFIGSTMVTDDGSSYSQANVHENNTSSFMQARRVWLAEIINERLIPLMSNLGIKIDKNDEFKWELSEHLKVSDWAALIGLIAPHFDLDEKQVSEKIGLDVETKEVQTNGFEPKKMEKVIKNLYNQAK